MKTLFLGNTDTVAMAPRAEHLSDHFLQKAATSAKRMVWMTDASDSIVTPTAMSVSFLEYVSRMKGDRTVVKSISPLHAAHGRPLPMTASSATEDLQVAEFLKALAANCLVDAVQPYIADEIADVFARCAGAESVSFGTKGLTARPIVTEHLNNKAKFREFASLLDVPIAIGATCVDEKELQQAVVSAMKVAGSAILKMARHSSGEGNRIINTEGSRNVLGAAACLSVTDMGEEALLTAISRMKLRVSRENPVVVEAYYENESCLGLHYSISGNSATLLGAAEQINNPTVGGQYWSTAVLDQVPHDVLSWSQRLADYTQTIGHLGPLSVDIIRGRSIGYVATEVNGRHGGFSTVRALIKSIGLGHEVEDGSRVVLVHHGLAIGASFPEALARLEGSDLHYDATTRRGAILMTEGYIDQGPYDIVIVGHDRQDVTAIESRLLELSTE